jgi:hypothetical protein
MATKIKTGIFFLVAVSALVTVTGCDALRDQAFSDSAPHLPEYRPPLLPDPQLHNRLFAKSDLPYQETVPAQTDGYGDPVNPVASSN